MDSRGYTGIFIGFLITGGVLMLNVAYQWIGWGFIVAGVLVALLFVNPKSRLRKYYCSVSGKLGVQLVYDGRNNVVVSGSYLTVYVGLRATVDIKIDKIDLKIGRKSLPSDWKTKVIQGDESSYINCPRPSWLNKGEHQSYLIAYTPEGFSKSNRFTVKVVSD